MKPRICRGNGSQRSVAISQRRATRRLVEGPAFELVSGVGSPIVKVVDSDSSELLLRERLDEVRQPAEATIIVPLPRVPRSGRIRLYRN